MKPQKQKSLMLFATILLFFTVVLLFLYFLKGTKTTDIGTIDYNGFNVIGDLEIPTELKQYVENMISYDNETTTYILPVYTIDYEKKQYIPLGTLDSNEYQWYWLLTDLTQNRKLIRITADYEEDIFVSFDLLDVTENNGLFFDKSLGYDLVAYANDNNYTPLFLVYIGQYWLFSMSEEDEVYAMGYMEKGDSVIACMNDSEFLDRHWRFLQKYGSTTIDVVEIDEREMKPMQ